MGINDGFSKLLCPWEAESLLSFLPTHPYFFSMLWFHTCLITSYYIPSSPLISRWGEKSMRWRKGEKETKCHNHRNSLERQRERLKKYRAAHEWWQHRVSRPKGIAGRRTCHHLASYPWQRAKHTQSPESRGLAPLRNSKEAREAWVEWLDESGTWWGQRMKAPVRTLTSTVWWKVEGSPLEILSRGMK